MVGLVGAIHVHVVEMHVHCSNHSILCCLGVESLSFHLR